MFACSRQLSSISNIMAIDESKEAYIRVVRELLDATVDSPIDLLLRADNCTSIARLRQLIKIPGLHDCAVKHRLNVDQYEDLQAIGSYIYWAHDEGHSDITTRTHGCFNTFFDKMEAYNHVVRVLLEAAIDSLTDLLLRFADCTSITRLRQLIKKPGLRRLSRRFGLSDGQYEDLLVLESYIIWTDNAGQFDITTHTQKHFEYYMHSIYNPDDEYKAAASQKRLSATTPTGDDTQPNPDNTEMLPSHL